jgi:hypothetical protein
MKRLAGCSGVILNEVKDLRFLEVRDFSLRQKDNFCVFRLFQQPAGVITKGVRYFPNAVLDFVISAYFVVG